MYNCGVERWEVEDPAIVDEIRKNHFVFVTGEHDQAREPTKKVYRAYRKAGVENILLMDIRHMTHRNPDSFHFKEAIEYLDSRIDQAL